MFKCFKDKEFLNKFIKISLPIMLSSLISFCVSFVDNIMVGSVSNETVSGVYAANQVSYLFYMSVFGILEGAGIFVQQYNGAKDEHHIKMCVRYKWYITILLLIVALPIVYFLGKYLIMAYSNKDSNYELILEEGINYLRIVAIGYIPGAVALIYSYTLREIGKTVYPMISSLLAIFTNCALNALFIYGLDMGGTGAAIATVIARIVECLFLVIVSKIKRFEFANKTFDSFKIEKELFKGLRLKTWPLFINEMGFAVGMMLQSLAFSQRDGVLSSISIVSTVSEIFAAFGNGLAVGIGVIVGSALGSNRLDDAKDANKKLLWLGTWISLLFAVIIGALSPVIPSLFTEVAAAQKELATKLILVFSIVLVFQTLALISYFTLRAGGRTIETLILDTGSMIFLYLPVSWFLAVSTNIDMLYIFMIVRGLDIIKAIIGIYLLKKERWVVNITV